MVSPQCLCRLVCLWLALAFVAACGDSNPIGPSNQPEVANNTDNFQFQASNLTRTSQTLTYSWVNMGTAANVDQSGAISSGQATVTLRDGSNALVYSGALGCIRDSSVRRVDDERGPQVRAHSAVVHPDGKTLDTACDVAFALEHRIPKVDRERPTVSRTTVRRRRLPLSCRTPSAQSATKPLTQGESYRKREAELAQKKKQEPKAKR